MFMWGAKSTDDKKIDTNETKKTSVDEPEFLTFFILVTILYAVFQMIIKSI